MTDNPIHGAVDRATDSDALETAARAGFAVSGLLHLLVAYIMLQIALGFGGSADKSGALATLGGQTGGVVMLWLTAAGLVALGLWHVAEVLIGPHPGERFGHYDDHSHTWKRLKAAGLAIMYFVIAFSAAKFAIGSGKSDTAAAGRHDRSTDAVRLGQHDPGHGWTRCHRRGRLSRVQGRNETVPQGSARRR